MKHLVYILLLGLCAPLFTACQTNEAGWELEDMFFADKEGSESGSGDSGGESQDPSLKKYYLVDLGLSVKWCKFNYGVTSNALEKKDFYTLDEAEALVREIDIPGLRLPTQDEVQELIQNCSLNDSPLGVSNPYVELKSKVNSRSIQIPIAGSYSTSGTHDGWKSEASFWTSTHVEDDYYRIFCYTKGSSAKWTYCNHSNARYAVRLVYDEPKAPADE